MNAEPARDLRLTVAPSVSAESRVLLEGLGAFIAAIPPRPVPRTLEDFDAAAERGAAAAAFLTSAALATLEPQVEARTVGGVPVLDVRPKAWRDDGTALVYVHGGGFVGGSAKANLLTAALAAATTKRRVVSIDYLLAPRGTYATILEQIVAVWTALLDERSAQAMGLFGDSAGGCIAAAATLSLRDRRTALPAALVLVSPVVDLVGEGDTGDTLAAIDFVDKNTLAVARSAYAPGADLRDPLVSPLFGDFSRDYPPTLLQVGTREVLLSDSVRFHRALRAHGRSSRLEVYEGMPHVFQSILADAPEGREAWAEMAAFWAEHLRAEAAR